MKVPAYTSSESLCNWIFRYAEFGIILTDAELRITDVNRWVEQHSGKKEIEFKGNSIFEIFPEIRQRGFERHLRDALSGVSLVLSSTFHEYFIHFPLIDDDYGFMKQTVRISPLLNSETVYGLIIHIEDVTDRVHREQLLQRKNDELQKINSTKDKFFSIISHDLRSPFTSLLGFSELLINDETIPPGNTKFLIETLHKSIRNQYQFLENLLEWSRIQSRKQGFIFDDVKIADIISHTLKVTAPLSHAKNIKVFTSCIPQNFTIFTDSQALTTAVYNLVINAIKFTYGGGTVEIKALRSDDSVVISVRDTGIGIPPERLDKLFRIDESVSTPGTDNEKGSGLGLLLVKEIVEKLNGSIRVESTEGKGSVFIINLPVKEQ